MAIHVREAGQWKAVKRIHVHQGGAWVPVQFGWVRDGGVWRNFYTAEVSVIAPAGGPVETNVERIFEAHSSGLWASDKKKRLVVNAERGPLVVNSVPGGQLTIEVTSNGIVSGVRGEDGGVEKRTITFGDGTTTMRLLDWEGSDGGVGLSIISNGNIHVVNKGRIDGGKGANGDYFGGEGGAGLTVSGNGDIHVINEGEINGGKGGAGGELGGDGGAGLTVSGNGSVHVINEGIFRGGDGGVGAIDSKSGIQTSAGVAIHGYNRITYSGTGTLIGGTEDT